jgi:oligoendopeptidase F
MTMTKAGVPPRNEIAKEYTWNAESVFETRDAWNAACEEIIAMLPEVQQYQGRLAEGASVLADFLEIADKIIRLIGKVFVYASMSSAVDSNDQQAMAMSGKARGLYGRVMAATAFSDRIDDYWPRKIGTNGEG